MSTDPLTNIENTLDAAFEAHLASTHFQEFDMATTNMVEKKTVKTYSEVTQ